MKKKQDWQILLNDFIEQNKDKDFAWGSWDCCIFSNAAIKAMTGKNVIPKTLKWKDEESAKVAIKDYGKDLKGALTKACKKAGLEEIGTAYMTAGDLILYKEETTLAGIHDGFNIISPTDGGLSVKSPELAVKAWRVPRG